MNFFRLLLRPLVIITVTFFLFFLLLFLYTKLAGPIPFSVNSVTTTKSDSYTVTGEGKSYVVPDIALLTAGVQASGASFTSVKDQLNSKINKVTDSVKNLGIDTKDIKTVNYSIYPTYDYQGGNQRITGYSASTSLQVTIRDLNKVNEVIDTVTTNGANQVSGVTFDVADKTKVEDEAREKAVTAAKKKAENAAKIAGFRLGRMINYTENFGGTNPPVPLRANTLEKAADSVATQVQPGTNEIIVTVSLSYEIQ